MDNINKIADNLRKGLYTSNPHGASQDMAILAGEYAYVMAQWEEILQRKPGIWSEMRKNFKSDTACERAWESTADGMKESGLRMRSKSIEKMMSALRALIRVAEGEARNLM